MKCYIFICLVIIACCSGCDEKKQRDKPGLTASGLEKKEQDILTREKLIDQREQEVARREQILDSAANRLQDSLANQHLNDSLMRSKAQLPGMYNVTMNCTQTNCTGYAVGDTKNEQWNIAFEGALVIIRAMSNNILVRTYQGAFKEGGIELEALTDNSTVSSPGKIVVRLQESKDKRLDGVREITRKDDCRVIYNLELKKQ